MEHNVSVNVEMENIQLMALVLIVKMIVKYVMLILVMNALKNSS